MGRALVEPSARKTALVATLGASPSAGGMEVGLDVRHVKELQLPSRGGEEAAGHAREDEGQRPGPSHDGAVVCNWDALPAARKASSNVSCQVPPARIRRCQGPPPNSPLVFPTAACV